MHNSLLPATVFVVTLIGVLVLRARATMVKIIGEVVLLALISGCLWLRGTSALPTELMLSHDPDADWLRALAVVWWLIGARLVAILIVLVLGRDARSRETRLFTDLLAGGIYVTAVLIVLNSVLDLRVNGLLATSGVIAIVLGLALQNTLSDVFSGVAVGIEQPFRVGHRIGIADHPEGMVVQMNWRAIRIQTDGDDLVTIPNSIVARSEIINRSFPTEHRAASVEIQTASALRSDTLIGLAKQALLLCPAILATPAPTVAIRHLGARTMTLGIGYYVATTPELAIAKGQLLRQVRRLFHHADVLGVQPETPEILLASLILFEDLKPEQIGELASNLISHRYDVGETLFGQGSHGASLYIIRSGVFEIVRDEPDGTHKLFGRIGAGEYLGEMSMMSGDPRPVTVTALTQAAVYELPRKAIEVLLGEDATLSAALERSIKRGVALLDRDEAARNCQPFDDDGSLMARIHRFLRHHHPKAS